MTLAELNDYPIIAAAIREVSVRIARCEARLIRSPRTDGAIVNASPKNTTEELFIELAALKTELSELTRQKTHILDFIDALPRRQREIFTRHFCRRQTFREIAIALDSTEDAVKKMCYRYIDR